ncbi:hypothetical protein EHM69_06755 [candidate division KSB1 bacterium]|nr:MAG: hypothetical protein EHM69_06755 [candidate division KSB1 bacterium]
MNPRSFKWFFGILAFLFALYLTLLIPDPAVLVSRAQDKEPFAWNRDEYWSSLESRFKEARAEGCAGLSLAINQRLSKIDSLNVRLRNGSLPPTMPVYGEVESNFFESGVLLAVCPSRASDYMRSFGELRRALKQQSVKWDMNSQAGRDCIYRLLYGGRIAIEEVILQSAKGVVSQPVVEANEPSETPSATILGMEIHSGDILVSRGGAPTSALIARGNDYPGNFSHVALIYIDENTGLVSIIESHIEKGVAIAGIEDYLKDIKLRVMVLRLRSDHPALQADPMLPHYAAKYMFGQAGAEHIPYDFAMNTSNKSKMFCSEVVSGAYSHCGVKLWAGLSNISSMGARSWLSAFGVRNFTTEEPSDLEYDPQLSVIVEWRDYETLYKDHLDNAVVDIMLESADNGAALGYDWYMLPVARVIKIYCAIINKFGAIGPIPEGMTATSALKNKWFSRHHSETVKKLSVLAQHFRQSNGYSPPYWDLIKLARQAYTSSVTR